MSIYSTSGIPSVSCQAESILPKATVVGELKERFKRIILLYDNDYKSSKNWGFIQANKISKQYNLPFIMIPNEFKAKDYFELVTKSGVKHAVNWLRSEIYK